VLKQLYGWIKRTYLSIFNYPRHCQWLPAQGAEVRLYRHWDCIRQNIRVRQLRFVRDLLIKRSWLSGLYVCHLDIIKVASSFAPGQITRKAFQGRRKIDIFDFPQRTPSFIFRQQAYCGDELSETELWTLCSYLCEPFK
jgi:hypothetical protein